MSDNYDASREETLEFFGDPYLLASNGKVISMEKGPDAVTRFQDILQLKRAELNQTAKKVYRCSTLGRKEWVAVSPENQIWICTICCEFEDRGGKIRGRFPRKSSSLTWTACHTHENSDSHKDAEKGIQD